VSTLERRLVNQPQRELAHKFEIWVEVIKSDLLNVVLLGSDLLGVDTFQASSFLFQYFFVSLFLFSLKDSGLRLGWLPVICDN